mgnify:CR=1 FL=1
MDATPKQLPVHVNGGMRQRELGEVGSPIKVRAIALDDGKTQLAIVVVDSCMMSRAFLDDAKAAASKKTDIRADRMFISATHTHTAPASMGCLGTDVDPRYPLLLKRKIIEAIDGAKKNLEPVQVGAVVFDANEYTALRRWVRRPDRIANDPFGNPTVRANMHAGRNWDDVTGESGPEDPDFSMVSFQFPSSISSETWATLQLERSCGAIYGSMTLAISSISAGASFARQIKIRPAIERT